MILKVNKMSNKYTIVCKQDKSLKLPFYKSSVAALKDCRQLNKINDKKDFSVTYIRCTDAILKAYNKNAKADLIALALKSGGLKRKTIDTILYTNYNI